MQNIVQLCSLYGIPITYSVCYKAKFMQLNLFKTYKILILYIHNFDTTTGQSIINWTILYSFILIPYYKHFINFAL